MPQSYKHKPNWMLIKLKYMFLKNLNPELWRAAATPGLVTSLVLPSSGFYMRCVVQHFKMYDRAMLR